MSEVAVLGGGLLGAAIARAAVDGGARVTVHSRTPRSHAGMWCRYDATHGMPDVADAAVFVALGPAPGQKPEAFWARLLPDVVQRAWAGGADRVSVAVPGGGVPVDPTLLQRSGKTTVVRFGPLLSASEGCVAPWIKSLRSGEVLRIPRGLPEIWPLVAEDAARAVWRLSGSGRVRVLRGSERMPATNLARLLAARFGGRWAERWVGGIDRRQREMLAAQVHLDDDWDDKALGPRTPVAEWVERLAGPRPKR